jgi:hypothetical protein
VPWRPSRGRRGEDVEDLIEAVTGGQATAVKIVLASVLLED